MTMFIMVRHGEPDYSICEKKKFMGHGNDLAPLSNKGIEQIKDICTDIRLTGAELIISSPYTRALQSAAIISRVLGLEIIVEVDLHEWLPDLSFRYSTFQEVLRSKEDFDLNSGGYPEGESKIWESMDSVEKRVHRILDKYKKHKKVIVVCHGMMALIVSKKYGTKDIRYGGILKYEYKYI